MNLFCKTLLIGLTTLTSISQAAAAINNFSPIYQWFKIIDNTAKSSLYGRDFYDTKHFSLASITYCDDQPNCLAYLIQTTFESNQGGQLILNNDFCGGEYNLLPIPLQVVDGNITTNAPATYILDNCTVEVTGDPKSESGYQITFNKSS